MIPSFREYTKKTRLVFVGDIMQHPDQLRYEYNNGFKYDEVFSEVKDILQTGDYVFGNLETTFCDFDTPPKDREERFCAPDELAKSLKRVGFTHLSICNNHMFDKGFEGVERTKTIISKHGMTPVFKNITVGEFEVLNFTTHLNVEDASYKEYMTVQSTTTYGTKIAIPHWGGQYTPIDSEQRQYKKTLNDLGFNIIVGSGPHITQDTESDNTSVCAYSLGDFLSAHQKENTTDIGKILIVDVYGDSIQVKEINTYTDTTPEGKSTIRIRK